MMEKNQEKGPSEKADIYSIMQAQLLMKLEEAMESDEKFTWIKPWKGAPYPCSYNHPKQPFSCPVNRLLLDTGEYLTFLQIKKLYEVNPNIKIKKGSKQAYVYQYYPIYEKDEKGNIRKDENGDPIIASYRIGYTREFHISDVTGLRSHFVTKEFEHEQTESTDMAEQLREAYCEKYGIVSEVVYGSGKAYYEKMNSRMSWPDPKQFKSIYEYYSTCFHEMAHSTMEQIDRSKFSYAQEELVAEITASMLCASLGLMDDGSLQNNIAYLQHWHGHLKEEKPKSVYFAIVEAQKAAQLILSSAPEIEKKLRPKIEQSEMALPKEEKRSGWDKGGKTCRRMKR